MMLLAWSGLWITGFLPRLYTCGKPCGEMEAAHVDVLKEEVL